jgi:hypothetical protein
MNKGCGDVEAARSKDCPSEFQPDEPQTHNALANARAQTTNFFKLLRKNSGRPKQRCRGGVSAGRRAKAYHAHYEPAD